MFRPSPGHLQALKEKQVQDFFYKNALWDPKCSQCVFVKKVYVILDLFFFEDLKMTR